MGVARTLALAINPGSAPAATAPVYFSARPRRPKTPATTDWWKWVLIAALAFLFFEAIYAWWREPDEGWTWRRRIVDRSFRRLSIALVVVALFDPTTGSSPPPTTLVLDRLLSIGQASFAEAEREWLATNDGCGEDLRRGPVRRRVGWQSPAAASARCGRPRGAAASPAAKRTWKGALALALARTPQGGRVVLFLDGRQTSGEPTALAAARAPPRHRRRHGGRSTAHPTDAAVTRLQAPTALHAGDPLSIEHHGTEHRGRPGEADGAPRRDVDRAPGSGPRRRRQPLPLRRQGAAAQGLLRVLGRGRQAPGRDTRKQNYQLGTTVRVEAAPRISSSSVLPRFGRRAAARSRRDRRLRVSCRAPCRPKRRVTRGVDAVVLEDVSSDELGKVAGRRRSGRRSATRALGFLALGGEPLLLARQVLQIAAPGSAAGEKPGAGQTAAQKRRRRAGRSTAPAVDDQRGRRGAEDRDGAGGGARRGRLPAQTPRPGRHRLVRNQAETAAAADPGRTEHDRPDRTQDQHPAGQRRHEHLQRPGRGRQGNPQARRPKTATSSCSPTGSANRAATSSWCRR